MPDERPETHPGRPADRIVVDLAVRLGLQLWAYGRAVRTGEDEPVAVPLIEDAASQAAHEAETVSGLEDEAQR